MPTTCPVACPVASSSGPALKAVYMGEVFHNQPTSIVQCIAGLPAGNDATHCFACCACASLAGVTHAIDLTDESQIGH